MPTIAVSNYGIRAGYFYYLIRAYARTPLRAGIIHGVMLQMTLQHQGLMVSIIEIGRLSEGGNFDQKVAGCHASIAGAVQKLVITKP